MCNYWKCYENTLLQSIAKSEIIVAYESEDFNKNRIVIFHIILNLNLCIITKTKMEGAKMIQYKKIADKSKLQSIVKRKRKFILNSSKRK